MSYATEYTAAHPTVVSPTFVQRVEMMLVTQAGFIYNENASTGGHAARAAYANRIAQPGVAANTAPGWVNLCAAQGLACDNTTTDAQMDGVAGSEWNLMSGA